MTQGQYCLLAGAASRQDEFDAVFAEYLRLRADAMVVAADPHFNDRPDQLVALAAKHSVPTIYEWREFVEAGGLMSYGASLKHTYRQLGIYAGRILKGGKPADLPIEQPTKFELVVNQDRKSARHQHLAVDAAARQRGNRVNRPCNWT